MHIFQMLVVWLLAALLTACGAKASPTTPHMADTGDRAPLAGTEWALTSLKGESLLEGTEINLYFEEAFLGGAMTCNRYGGGPDTGQYLVTDDGALTFPHLFAVTVQLCSEPQGIMEQETAYIEALLSAATYRVVDDRLEIIGGAGDAILVFARKGDRRVSNAASARDKVLAYLAEQYGERGPSPDLSWTETRTTVVIGKSKVEYTADTDQGNADWEIWISFPVEAPEDGVYEAMVFRRSGDFYWEGTVDAAGQVAELRVNVVREASLEQTTSIEILELDLAADSPTRGENVERLAIADPQLLDQILAALDTDLQVTPQVACIPLYTLQFHLSDGGIQEFSYSCDGASFLRGEQAFWRGKDFRPPEGFDALLQAQLVKTLPSVVNVVEQAGLAATVRIEVHETVSSKVADSPGIVEAHIDQRLTITDSVVLAQFVAALNTDLVLGPRADVPTPYILEFHLDDGTVLSFGYALSGERAGIIRGEQGFFRGQDAEPPVEFETLIEAFLASTGDRP